MTHVFLISTPTPMHVSNSQHAYFSFQFPPLYTTQIEWYHRYMHCPHRHMCVHVMIWDSHNVFLILWRKHKIAGSSVTDAQRMTHDLNVHEMCIHVNVGRIIQKRVRVVFDIWYYPRLVHCPGIVLSVIRCVCVCVEIQCDYTYRVSQPHYTQSLTIF